MVQVVRSCRTYVGLSSVFGTISHPIGVIHISRRIRGYTLKDALDPNHPTSAYVGLRPLMLKIEANRQHLQVIRSMLPSDCGEHCVYVSRTPKVMTLIVDSSSWATQIRLDAKRLLNELQQLSDYVELTQVRVRVSKS